jgi:hypothetical protein
MSGPRCAAPQGQPRRSRSGGRVSYHRARIEKANQAYTQFIGAAVGVGVQPNG